MGFFKQTIRDVPLAHKTVLLRTDYNVPLNDKGEISDDLRIRASIPTIQYLLNRGCKVVIISHLGRPEGKDLAYSLESVARRLADLLHKEVRFSDASTGDRAYQSAKRTPKGGVVLFENVRFHAGEETDDEKLAKDIVKASGAQYFVQDGFGVVHRAHASTHAITLLLPSVAGLLLEKEYMTIQHAMEKPERPLLAVLGGAKVSDKITVIERFVEVADKIIIGGAMANTFLDYKGYSMGASKVEAGQAAVLDAIYRAATKKVGADRVDDFIILLVDLAVSTTISPESTRTERLVDSVQATEIALDIGDKSVERVVREVKKSKTVIWNGPLGYAEYPAFAHGSARLALALATHPAVTSIIGGGDTADFVLKWDGHGGKSFSHVSTGGGAGLELMAGKKLPGVESLLDARR